MGQKCARRLFDFSFPLFLQIYYIFQDQSFMSVPSWRRWICPFLFLWLLYLKELTGREMKQYIVSFNVSLNQYEQKKYLSEQFQQDSFDFVFRMYISREIPSDFAVVKLTDADQGEWLVSLSSSPPSLIIGIYEDSLESRQLLGSNGKHGGEDDAFLDFQPSSLTSSFSADGVRGQGVKVAVFDTGNPDIIASPTYDIHISITWRQCVKF